jgi:HEAT repeat protein
MEMKQQKVDGNAVATLVEELLNGAEPRERRHAAEELAIENSYAAIGALAAALQDENKGVRDAANRSLLTIGTEQVARSVVEYITDTNIISRNMASDILVRLGGLSLNALLPCLYDSDQDVRKFAVDILGLIGDRSPVSHLIPLLHDPDDNVLISTIEALGNLRAEEAVDELCATFDRQDDLKPAVAEALGKIGGDGAADFLLKKFCEWVSNPPKDPLLLYTILEALAQVGSKKAFTILNEHLHTFSGKLQHVLLHCMIHICERSCEDHKSWIPYKTELLEGLLDDDPHIQISIMNALCSIEGNDVTKALLKRINLSESVDAELVPLLVQRHNIIQVCTEMIAEGTMSINKTSLDILSQTVLYVKYENIPVEMLQLQENILPMLAKLLGEYWSIADQEVRPIIIDLLFKLDGDRAIEILKSITEDPDPWLRMQVLELLASVSDRRAADFLAQFVNDDDETVRQLAYSVLEAKGYLGEPAANSLGGE